MAACSGVYLRRACWHVALLLGIFILICCGMNGVIGGGVIGGLLAVTDAVMLKKR